MLKKFLSHTAIYGLAPQLPKIASFLVLPIITKDLTDVDFGVAGILAAYTSIITAIAALGLRVVLTNTYYKHPWHYKKVWRQIYGFLYYWNIIYAIILGGLVWIAVPEVAIQNRLEIMLLNVIPLVIMGQTSLIGINYFRLKQEPLQIGLRSAIFGLLSIGLSVLFISGYKMGYMGWFWATAISTTLMNLSYWYVTNFKIGLSPIFNFKRRLIRNSLKVALPTIPHYYASYLLDSSDRLIMDQLQVNTGQIGEYSTADQFKKAGNSLSLAINWAVVPFINEAYKAKDDQSAKNILLLVQWIFYSFTFLSCIWLKEVFEIAIKNDVLKQAYPIGIILLMSLNYRPMYLGFTTKLIYEEKTHVLWKISLAAGIINVVLNLILIPQFGFAIAALTTFIALLYMGHAGYYYPTYKKLEKVNYHHLQWMVLTILLTLIAYFGADYAISIKIVMSIAFAILAVSMIFFYNSKLDKAIIKF